MANCVPPPDFKKKEPLSADQALYQFVISIQKIDYEHKEALKKINRDYYLMNIVIICLTLYFIFRSC